MANSVDPNEGALYKPPHLDLHCLPIPLFFIIGVLFRVNNLRSVWHSLKPTIDWAEMDKILYILLALVCFQSLRWYLKSYKKNLLPLSKLEYKYHPL